MHRFSLRSGMGEFGASPNYPPLNSDIYARILGLSPETPPTARQHEPARSGGQARSSRDYA